MDTGSRTKGIDLGKLTKLKSGKTWETVQIEGVVKKSKKSQVSVGKCSKLGGEVLTFPKSPKFPRVPKTNKIMTHFHLMRTQKHKILSIGVLNMG